MSPTPLYNCLTTVNLLLLLLRIDYWIGTFITKTDRYQHKTGKLSIRPMSDINNKSGLVSISDVGYVVELYPRLRRLTEIWLGYYRAWSDINTSQISSSSETCGTVSEILCTKSELSTFLYTVTVDIRQIWWNGTQWVIPFGRRTCNNLFLCLISQSLRNFGQFCAVSWRLIIVSFRHIT